MTSLIDDPSGIKSEIRIKDIFINLSFLNYLTFQCGDESSDKMSYDGKKIFDLQQLFLS